MISLTPAIKILKKKKERKKERKLTVNVGPPLWNYLNDEISELHSFDSCKRAVKKLAIPDNQYIFYFLLSIPIPTSETLIYNKCSSSLINNSAS